MNADATQAGHVHVASQPATLSALTDGNDRDLAARLVALGLLTGRGGLLMLTEAGLRNSLPTWPSKEPA